MRQAEQRVRVLRGPTEGGRRSSRRRCRAGDNGGVGTSDVALTHAVHRFENVVATLAIVCFSSGSLALWQTLRTRYPFIDLRRFVERSFSLGCGLSFIFGMGLYGSVYLLSIFLGAVLGHSPLEIGEIMFVSGAAQLLTAPLAAWIDPRPM